MNLSFQPDTRQTGDWQYDIVRSQHYLHYADNTKPVLNWKNTKVSCYLNCPMDGLGVIFVKEIYLTSEIYDYIENVSVNEQLQWLS